MRVVPGISCLAVLAAVAVAAPGPPPEQLAWTHGLPAAQDEAQKRKVPLLVVLNLDGEVGNQRMVDDVYTDAALRESSKRLVVTIASIAKHAEVDDPKGGRKVCSRFGHVTCDEHRATEEVVRKEWLKFTANDDVDSPRHIFRAPDGRPLFERVWTLAGEELVKLMDRAIAACAPESLAAWDTTEARLQRAFEPLSCIRESALKELVPAHDVAIDAKLLELVRHTENDEAARDVVRALGADSSPARSEGIRKLLAAPVAGVRAQAAAAIAGFKEKDVYDVLFAAYGKEKAIETKCVMLRALAVCGGDPAKVRELMLKTAKPGGDATLRTHAIVCLAPWAKEDAVVDLIRKVPVNDKLPERLRAAAIWTLGLSGRKEIAEELRPFATEKDDTLKYVSKAAIARLSGTETPNYHHLRDWVAYQKGVTLPGDEGQ